MKNKFGKWLTAFAVLTLFATNVWANKTVTCTVSGGAALPTISYTATNYSPNTSGSTITPFNVRVSCARDNGANNGTGASDLVSYSVTAGNGSSASGTQNVAKNGTSSLNYDFFRLNPTTTTCANEWAATNPITKTYTSSAGVTDTVDYTVYGCITTGQTSAQVGDHLDTVVITLTGSAGSGLTFATPINTSANVKITVPKECSTNLNTTNTVVDFGSYTALGSAKPSTGGNFNLKCTNLMGYTMALTDVNGAALTNGVIAGLNYSLALSASGGTGNGADQPYTINGTMPAGQAGSCASGACAGTTTNTSHYLTVTY